MRNRESIKKEVFVQGKFGIERERVSLGFPILQSRDVPYIYHTRVRVLRVRHFFYSYSRILQVLQLRILVFSSQRKTEFLSSSLYSVCTILITIHTAHTVSVNENQRTVRKIVFHIKEEAFTWIQWLAWKASDPMTNSRYLKDHTMVKFQI